LSIAAEGDEPQRSGKLVTRNAVAYSAKVKADSVRMPALGGVKTLMASFALQTWILLSKIAIC